MKLKINLKKKGHNTKVGGDLKRIKNKLNEKINEVIKTHIFFF